MSGDGAIGANSAMRGSSTVRLRYCKGLKTLLAVALAVAGATHAVAAQPALSGRPGRLSVQGLGLAVGTRTRRAGLQWLDSLHRNDSLLQGAVVYVPPRAVGSEPVPLLVLVHGSAMTGIEMLTWDHGIFQHFADSTGTILLAPTSSDGGWDTGYDPPQPTQDLQKIDAALRTVLRENAIDPTRIALLGTSAGAGVAFHLGYANGDLFSRVLAFSGCSPFDGVHEFDPYPRHGLAAFFIAMPKREAEFMDMSHVVPWLRQQGYGVTLVVDTLEHGLPRPRTEAGLTWLTKSWR